MLPCFIDTARDYPGSVFGKGPDTHQGCRAVAGPVAVADEMQILHRGFAATHEVAEWAEGRTETSAPDQMVVVELAQTIEDGDSAERAGIAELTEMRKRDNVPEVRAGIATENPAAAAEKEIAAIDIIRHPTRPLKREPCDLRRHEEVRGDLGPEFAPPTTATFAPRNGSGPG